MLEKEGRSVSGFKSPKNSMGTWSLPSVCSVLGWSSVGVKSVLAVQRAGCFQEERVFKRPQGCVREPGSQIAIYPPLNGAWPHSLPHYHPHDSSVLFRECIQSRANSARGNQKLGEIYFGNNQNSFSMTPEIMYQSRGKTFLFSSRN